MDNDNFGGLLPMRFAQFICPTVLILLSSLASVAAASSSVMLTDLKCEYFMDPIGIDVPRPRLFWKLKTDERGQCQTGYQVLVASTAELLRRDQGDLWDSGDTTSTQSVFVPYAGKPLRSRQQCWWKVRIRDKDGHQSAWSAPAQWTMGILQPGEWRGRWITSDLELMDYQKELRAMSDFGMEPESEIWQVAERCRKMTENVTTAPGVYLRREFDTTAPVRRATAYVCGLGLHEMYLNGARVSDHHLNPSFTDYQKRVLYVSHDVTSAVKTGRNAIGVLLGNGWYNLIIPHTLRFYAADYIAPPRLLMEIDIEHTDGSHSFVGSDTEWKFTTDGPLTFNCLLGGETYDARKEFPGWDAVGFDDSRWKKAVPGTAPDGRLCAQMLPPVRTVQRSAATSVTLEKDRWRFDIGFETAGWAQLKVRGKPGEEITVNYPGSGTHTLGRYQTCKFIRKGGTTETFASRFSYNGYQYVEVTGLNYQPSPADVEAQVVVSDLPCAGSFSCSDERLNKLQQVLLRTLQNYIIHIPNDPTREKAGWTQDVENGFWETVYNVDAAQTYLKWQRDFLDAIHPDGYMPPVAPGRFDGPTINGPWWGGVVVYTPWYIYQFYGDTQILAESYKAMQMQFNYLTSIAKDHIVEWGLGDWMEVGSVRPVRTPVPITSTIAYYWFSDILTQTALLLGRNDDATSYAAVGAKIRDAYNHKFFNAETGDYAKGSQTSQLLSLYFGLVPDDKRDLVRKRLLERITADNNHLSTGFVGTPLLLTGLAEMGHPEVAWTIATQADHPGFIDAILNRGQTVMKEDWQGGLVQMPSLQGPIGTWYYHTLAGIRVDPKLPGFKHVILKPELAGDLTWARAEHVSLYGTIGSSWKIDGDNVVWEVVIPANSTATLFVPTTDVKSVTESGKPLAEVAGLKMTRNNPGSVELEAESGRYSFSSKWDK
ncbi:MAG: family 78 glycoside hydrolase catalytic domain [Candidatus Sumerlaeaceae bacterium]